MFCFRKRNKNKNESIITLQRQVDELQQKIDIDRDGIVTKDELEIRLSQIPNEIDTDSNGIITKDELQQYIKDNFSIYDTTIQNLEIKLNDKDDIIRSLQQELNNKNNTIESLKDDLNIVENEKQHCEDNLIQVRNNKLDITQVSHSAIKKYVRESLKSNSNNKHIPDFLEGPMEETIINILLHILAQACDQADITIFNHKLGLSLLPSER